MSDSERQSGNEPAKFQNGFWSKDLKVSQLRKTYLKKMTMACVLTILVAWACLPFYWGSLWKEYASAKGLSAWIVNLDVNSSVVATALNNAAEQSLAGLPPHLGWQIKDATLFKGEGFGGNVTAELMNSLIEEKAWLVVVVNQGVEAALLNARQNGNASFSGSSAVSAFYASGRNENGFEQLIAPQLSLVVEGALQTASTQSTTSYIQENAANATAMAALARASGTIATPYGLTQYDLAPFSVPVASAVDLVGLIYLLILTFIQTMAGVASYGPLAPYLKYRSLVLMRICVPLISYVFIALFYTMLDLPFRVPFDAKYTYAGGFFLWYVFVWLGMAALGLATEAVVTLIGPPFMPYFLVCWIINAMWLVNQVNVAEVPIPIPTTGNVIYRIGYALPFWNLSSAVRTIIFKTKNHLGRNAGVLIAWIVLSLCTIPLFVWLKRRSAQKQAAREKDK